ncbi:MAG: type I 3-dehydroquinate dehydratase [Acidobacteria bacterium]|nr:type I 3-dehydroquinate dehydratase [Acidobacteriota bacterium]
MTFICVPLSAPTTEQCCQQMVRLASGCDLFEIRADAFQAAPDLPEIFRQAPRPILWTHRAVAERGRDNPRQGERLEEYRAALELGARWVDVEWMSGLAPRLDAFADRLVLSLHDFEKTPADVVPLAARMAEVRCGVIKVATLIRRTEDLEGLVRCARWLRQKGRKFVVLGMGDDGKPLRLLSRRLGCEWTYVALERPTAAGQLTAQDLEMYRFASVGPRSRVLAVIGNPVGHSLSPWFHNSAYAAMKLDALYLAIRVDDLDAYLRLAAELDVFGWSVTLPWKTEMARRCTLQDAASRQSGAVNTVLRAGERYLGWNTDWAGFLQPLRRRRSLAGLRACVVGTGGAARTAAAALLSEGAQVLVLGRRQEALHAFASEFPVRTGLLQQSPEVSGELIVNATPVGMSPATDSMPVAVSMLKRFAMAYDLVYTPPRTEFLCHAEESGLEVISGWEMFVGQAVEQIRIFTGCEPPPAWLQAQLAEAGP